MAEKLTELFEQARTAQSRDRTSSHPSEHPNRDFFVADILDRVAKDVRSSMEQPSYRDSRDRKGREPGPATPMCLGTWCKCGDYLNQKPPSGAPHS
jgi:hypothetical protein